jgi:mono/diheme cytochrome c family protein
MRVPSLLLALLLAGCSGDDAAPAAPAPAPATNTEAAAPAAPAPAQAAADSPTGDSPEAPGEVIYKSYCITCHQADGSGKPTADGRPIAGSFSGDAEILAQSDEQLLRTIRVGKTGRIGSMPPWAGILSKEQRADVLAYIRATFSPAPAEPPADAPK